MLVVGLITWPPMVAGAQIPGSDPLDDLTDPVTDIVEDTTQTVEDTTQTINETTESVTQVVENSASSTTGTTPGVDIGGVDGGASGDGGSGGAGSIAGSVTESIAEADPDSTESGSTRTGGGSNRTRARAAEAGGPHGPRASSALDLRGRTELEPAYRVSPLVVSKLNDANRNGVYSDTEAAPRAEADVSFQVVMTNAGDVELTIIDIRDAFEDGSGEFGIPVCKDLIGSRLPAKSSAKCSFTLEDYAPEKGQKVNTLLVTGVETADPSTRVSGVDTSTVTGSDVAVLGMVATNPLPTTGAQLAALVKAMFGFMIAGTLLVAAARLREEASLGSRRIEG